jgi:nucleoside-diphosphate-sugar epimerase
VSTKQNNFIAEDFDRIYPVVARKLEGLAGHTLLVTGGAGFLGSWICELVHYLNRVDKAGIKLFVVDRDRERFAQRLPHLVKDEAIEFIRCDIRSLVEMPREVNYVIHAAATPDNRFHASSPIETMTSIAEGTANALRAANRVSNLIKFVNVSASTIYAPNTQGQRISESAPGLALSLKSAFAYSEAKRYAEVLCSAARSEARIPVVTVRPFTFCGAYQELDSPWVLNNFINDALHQRPIRILGDGMSVRSLMYGADLACWMLVIMLQADSGQVFNVGSENGETVGELARRVADCFSPVPMILINTSLAGHTENSRLVPDVSAAKSQFGLEIYTDLERAISKTIAWYRASLQTS